jgi:Copper type II ascorbate-dependent monooxygenase, C-terminal domain
MNNHLALLLSALVGSVACSTHVATSSDDGVGGAGTGAGPGGPGATTVGSATGTATGAGGMYVPPPNSQTLTFGPYDVDPHTERTQCITKRLSNMTPLFVHQMHNQMIGVSHHMIVYRSTATDEAPDPVDCQPFADTLSGSGVPMMITQKHDDTLDLPDGVAFTLDANQMIKLEVHFINPQATTQTIEANATFEAMDPATFKNAAGFLFAGTTQVSLPPNAPATATAFIPMPSDLIGKNFFGFTGHVHKFGTNVVVGSGLNGGPYADVYDVPNFTWSEPPTVYHDPPVVLTPSQGFDITCSYENTSSQQVSFGESANNEMCFFWAYYYPDAGAKIIF